MIAERKQKDPLEKKEMLRVSLMCDRLMGLIEDVFGIKRGDISSNSKNRTVSDARRVFAFVLYACNDYMPEEDLMSLVGKDRTTWYYYHMVHNDKMVTDIAYKRKFISIAKQYESWR